MTISNNFKYNLDFYEKYHQNTFNKIIHILCIPLIVWSFFILINYLNINNYSVLFQPSLLVYLFYTIYYFKNESYYSIFSAVFYLFILIQSNIFYINIKNAWFYAILIQVFSWILQLASHKYIEKNSPAFVNGIKQSFLTAPLFIIIDLVKFIYKIINNKFD